MHTVSKSRPPANPLPAGAWLAARRRDTDNARVNQDIPFVLRLRRDLARHWVLPTVGGLALVLSSVPGLRPLLRYQRDALAQGEWWRLLTGHLVHLGPAHLAWDLAALVLIWRLFGDRLDNGRWLLVTLTAMVGIDAGLWWLDPRLRWYLGLSGLLHGWFAAGGLAEWPRDRRYALVVLGLLAAKLGWEALAGPLPGTAAAIGGAVVTQAHLYGALSVLPLAWWLRAPALRGER